MKELNIRELQDRLDAISEKRKPKIKKPDNLTTAIEEIPSDGFNYDNMEDIGFLYDNIPVSYTHLPSPRDLSTSRMPSSA